MDTIAYAAVHGSVGTADKFREPARQRQGWFIRFVEALYETRMRQAEREIRKFASLMPQTTDQKR